MSKKASFPTERRKGCGCYPLLKKSEEKRERRTGLLGVSGEKKEGELLNGQKEEGAGRPLKAGEKRK